MVQIDNLSDDANQITRVPLPDGSLLVLNFIYRPAIQRWSVSITRNAFVLNNVELCAHPNLLREFRNTLPFGLAVTSTDGGDPVLISDFVSGRISIFVLDAADVQTVETSIFGALV